MGEGTRGLSIPNKEGTGAACQGQERAMPGLKDEGKAFWVNRMELQAEAPPSPQQRGYL